MTSSHPMELGGAGGGVLADIAGTVIRSLGGHRSRCFLLLLFTLLTGLVQVCFLIAFGERAQKSERSTSRNLKQKSVSHFRIEFKERNTCRCAKFLGPTAMYVTTSLLVGDWSLCPCCTERRPCRLRAAVPNRSIGLPFPFRVRQKVLVSGVSDVSESHARLPTMSELMSCRNQAKLTTESPRRV